jgi:hypothetical protein
MVGWVVHPRRYGDDSDDVELEEQADPETWGDSSTPSVRERVHSRRHQFYMIAVAGLVFFGIVAGWSQTYFPELYNNKAIRLGTIVVGVAAASATATANSVKQKIGSLAFLGLHIPNKGGKVFIGRMDTDSEGNRLFIPIKGLRLGALRGSEMKLDDLPAHVVQNYNKLPRRLEDDSAAKIRVEDALSQTVEAAYGRFVLVLTDGLEYDPFARGSDIYTTPPETVDPETYDELRVTMEETNRENKRLRSELDEVEDERDYYQRRANERREKILNEFVQQHAELISVQNPTRQTGEDSQPDVQDLVNEWTPDDDS